MIPVKSDNPTEIAARLIQQHGQDGAYQAALEGVLKAQEDGDNYRLSVWREIKATLPKVLQGDAGDGGQA